MRWYFRAWKRNNLLAWRERAVVGWKSRQMNTQRPVDGEGLVYNRHVADERRMRPADFTIKVSYM